MDLTLSGEGWMATGVDGLRAKLLRYDAAEDRRTVLLELAPGCRVPAHSHSGPEECYVVTGDLSTRDSSGDCTLFAGDYMRMPARSEHGVQWTRDGCVAVVIGSRSDELLPRLS
jgi:anti-sigma factor ChrR (cupin superfamily)